MSTKLRFFVFFVCITNCVFAFQQVDFFEGIVTYSTKEFDETGKQILTLVEKEKVFFAKSVILTRPIAGSHTFIVGNIDVYLNAETKTKYSIDHDNNSIKIIDDFVEIPRKVTTLFRLNLTT